MLRKGIIGAGVGYVEAGRGYAEKARCVVGDNITVGDTDPGTGVVWQAIVVALRLETVNRVSCFRARTPFGHREFRSNGDIVRDAVHKCRAGDDQIRALTKLAPETHRDVFGVGAYGQVIFADRSYPDVCDDAGLKRGRCSQPVDATTGLGHDKPGGLRQHKGRKKRTERKDNFK